MNFVAGDVVPNAVLVKLGPDAADVLVEGGSLVAKLFQGGGEAELLKRLNVAGRDDMVEVL